MKLNTQIKLLRRFRKWHRYLGLSIALLIFISSLTGILLALKKDISLLQPITQKGEQSNMELWKPLKELASISQGALIELYPSEKENTIDKMDVRPSKGIIKVLFKNGYWEVQIDATTGEVKSIDRRHSDWIEALHDGSIISDWFKVISMNYLGWVLLIMMISGCWLWYGPKNIRHNRKRN